MGSVRFHGVHFVAYPNDHPPRHIHGFTADTEVIVDLQLDGKVSKADRWDAVRPPNAKRSDIKKVFNTAATHFDQLVALWENIHGKA